MEENVNLLIGEAQKAGLSLHSVSRFAAERLADLVFVKHNVILSDSEIWEAKRRMNKRRLRFSPPATETDLEEDESGTLPDWAIIHTVQSKLRDMIGE